MARKYFKSDATEYTQKLADYAVDLKYEKDVYKRQVYGLTPARCWKVKGRG